MKSVDPDMPVENILPLRDVLNASVEAPRFRTLLIGAFALMAIVLSAVGVCGLISFLIAQRTRETEIRVALGGARQVMLPVLREEMTLALPGVAFLATYIPARRVLRVDPIAALRAE